MELNVSLIDIGLHGSDSYFREELKTTIAFVKATANTSAKINKMFITNAKTLVIRTC